MFSWLTEYFKNEGDNDPSFIRMTRNILIFVIVTNLAIILLVSGLLGENTYNPSAIIFLSITFLFQAISLYFVNHKNVLLAKISVPLGFIVAITSISISSNGIKSPAITALPVVLVIAAILMGKRFLAVALPLSIISVVIVAYYDLNRKIAFARTGLDDTFIILFLLLACAGIIQLLVGRLNESIQLIRKSEETQRNENVELNQLRTTLEERVNLRTAELEIANKNNARRASQFEAISQVARVISSIQELDELLPTITALISQQFGHYHTGIFLIDDQREFAVLRAANSDGGKAMLSNEHKLSIGQTGIVGYVTATGQPRIALDVGHDAVFFDNPFLPNTRSEIALPLQVGKQVIGALDVQSEQSNAFSENDIEVLTTLADQVSIAIQNARALDETKKSLAEAQSTFSHVIQEAWKVLQPQKVGLGFELSGQSIKSLKEPSKDKAINEALEKGQIVSSKTNDSETVAIPIRLRNEIIGVMNLKTPNGMQITNDDVEIAQAVADRLSLAIETATLLETSQRRADIEKLTTNISAQVSSSTHFDSILKTVAEELSRALRSEVIVQIDPVSLQLSAGEN